MFEHRIEHQNYFDFPVSVENFQDNPIEKLLISHCHHARINLQHPVFAQLKFLIIENCAFLDISSTLDHCDLQEFTLKHAKYIRILTFQGAFSAWSQLTFQNCKHSFLIGPFSGNINLERLNFVNCKGIHVFEKATQLPKLTTISFSYSYHMTLTFAPLQAPKLEEITFDHCKYFVEKSLGVGWGQLKKFTLNNCDKFYFPKTDLEFYRQANNYIFTPIPKHSPKDIENIDADFQKLERLITQSLESDQKSLELDDNEDLQEFPKKDLPKKYCPGCGEEAIAIARYCAQCGKKFRM